MHRAAILECDFEFTSWNADIGAILVTQLNGTSV